jgi:hypothetical protein
MRKKNNNSLLFFLMAFLIGGLIVMSIVSQKPNTPPSKKAAMRLFNDDKIASVDDAISACVKEICTDGKDSAGNVLNIPRTCSQFTSDGCKEDIMTCCNSKSPKTDQFLNDCITKVSKMTSCPGSSQKKPDKPVNTDTVSSLNDFCNCRKADTDPACGSSWFGSGCADRTIKCCIDKGNSPTDCNLYGNSDRQC